MTKLRKRTLLIPALLLALVLAAGCSPEYTRVRGGGMGADVGNRALGPSIDLHGPVNPNFGAPLEGKAIQQGR